MKEEMDMVMRLVENIGKTSEGVMEVVKLTDDNIDVYLTTFERQMATYEIDGLFFWHPNYR